MLRFETYNAAIPFAVSLDEANKFIVANPDTILSKLVSASTPSFGMPDNGVNNQVEHYGRIVEGTSADVSSDGSMSGFSNSPHSLLLNNSIESISKLVTSHLSFARSVVKPVVMQLVYELKNYLLTNSIKEPSTKFNIITLDLHEIFNSNNFIDSLEFYEGKTLLRPEVYFTFDSKSSDAIRELITSGDIRTDTLIAGWLSTLDDNFLNTVWDSFFTATNGQSLITIDEVERLNAFDRINYGLAIYLIATKLNNSVQDSSLTLKAYRSICSDLQAYGAITVLTCLLKVGIFNKAKTLVITKDSSKYLLRVNGVVYRDWLKAGGNTDVLFGIIVTDKQLSSQSLIDQSADSLKASWTSYCSLYKSQEANKQFAYYKEFLESKFTELLQTPSDIEQTFITKNTSHYQTVNKLFKEELASLSSTNIADINDVALRTIAKCRFYYSSAYEILNDINEAAKVNPNIDVREAALLATINYLADYLSEQITIAK